MYSVRVRDRVMIAHSFKGEVFGPAQRLHGATYVVDVTFGRPELDPDGIVVDIGRAQAVLAEALQRIAYRNLDEMPEFAGVNTTTEFLSRWIWDRMREALEDGRLGPHARGVTELAVELAESDIAWAGYRASLR
ncbi:MAG: 6-carboxytetrahydropterin synthase [Geminicoccaceae bacterium]|nr:6-carboxytetrahydropterin synthase [Geminicoccaceae bacterium]